MDDLEIAKNIARQNLGKISESVCFLGICSENYAEDPTCLMQFALAVLLDKPLYLLIAKGVNPGKNLIHILEGYEFYIPDDEESFKQASEKLMVKMKRKISETQNNKINDG